MRNLKLTIAYDGSDFHGFQTQRGSGLRTVQQELAEAWQRLTGENAQIVGAGRTDTGVHASGQVVNVRTASTAIPDDRVAHALNAVLADDLTVVKCEHVPNSFHARFDALSKMYEYSIYNDTFPSPLHRRYAYFVRGRLNVDAMDQAAGRLVGRHDFAAFSGNNRTVHSTVRTVMMCSVDRSGPLITLRVEADGFLYHMVRTIVGSLLCVAKGERRVAWISEALNSGDRAQAGPTAPPHGLVLRWVRYPSGSDSIAGNTP